jgi:hypothetical protein
MQDKKKIKSKIEIMYIKEDEEFLGERFLGELIWVFFGSLS